MQPSTSLQCHFTQSHIDRVHMCSAVTCHLHFWQNDWDLLPATVVTLGWNRYQNKSTDSWLRRRQFSYHSCRDSNPGHFNHKSGALTIELPMLPRCVKPYIARSSCDSVRFCVIWSVCFFDCLILLILFASLLCQISELLNDTVIYVQSSDYQMCRYAVTLKPFVVLPNKLCFSYCCLCSIFQWKVCVCVWERESLCVCVCVCARARARMWPIWSG